jgi:hypothetical protein
MQILVRFSDYVTTTASKRTQFLAGGRTRALWRQNAGRADAGVMEAGRRQSGRKMRALWRQDAGFLSYFLAVL